MAIFTDPLGNVIGGNDDIVTTSNDDVSPIYRRNTTFPTAGAMGYSVSNLTYPEKVGSSQDLQHYVSFYVNVRSSSKFDKNNRIGYVDTAADKNDIQNRSDIGKAGVGAKGVQGAIGGAIMGAAAWEIAKKVSSGIGATKGVSNRVAAVAGTGAGLATAYAIASDTIFKAEKTQRLSDVITLAIQESPSVSYGVQWEIGELGTLGAMAGGNTAAAESTATTANMASDIARRITESTISLPGILGSTNRLQDFIQAKTKRVANPQREQLFKAVGFRQFTFTYKFMPGSSKETGNVKDIINKFKFHMHPELSDSGIYYIYPSEFDIQYYYRGKENEYFHKISTCALTDMSVQYGGGEFSSFDDGAPTEITMMLKFTELETLTKERITAGY